MDVERLLLEYRPASAYEAAKEHLVSDMDDAERALTLTLVAQSLQLLRASSTEVLLYAENATRYATPDSTLGIYTLVVIDRMLGNHTPSDAFEALLRAESELSPWQRRTVTAIAGDAAPDGLMRELPTYAPGAWTELRATSLLMSAPTEQLSEVFEYVRSLDLDEPTLVRIATNHAWRASRGAASEQEVATLTDLALDLIMLADDGFRERGNEDGFPILLARQGIAANFVTQKLYERLHQRNHDYEGELLTLHIALERFVDLTNSTWWEYLEPRHVASLLDATAVMAQMVAKRLPFVETEMFAPFIDRVHEVAAKHPDSMIADASRQLRGAA